MTEQNVQLYLPANNELSTAAVGMMDAHRLCKQKSAAKSHITEPRCSEPMVDAFTAAAFMHGHQESRYRTGSNALGAPDIP